MGDTAKAMEALVHAKGWIEQAEQAIAGDSTNTVAPQVIDLGRKPMDVLFGQPVARMSYSASHFEKVAGEDNLLIHKSKRDLWALSDDGSAIVRLYDPVSEPIILEKTASVEERDAIRLYANQARRKLVASGVL